MFERLQNKVEIVRKASFEIGERRGRIDMALEIMDRLQNKVSQEILKEIYEISREQFNR